MRTDCPASSPDELGRVQALLPQQRLISPDPSPLQLDMLDDDMAYSNVPEYPYFA